MVPERFFDSGWIHALRMKGFRTTQILERNL
jgi:hypothetical protein